MQEPHLLDYFEGLAVILISRAQGLQWAGKRGGGENFLLSGVAWRRLGWKRGLGPPFTSIEALLAKSDAVARLSRKLATVRLCRLLSSSCTEQRDCIDPATSSGAPKYLSIQCHAAEMDTSGLRSSVLKAAARDPLSA